MLSLLLAVSITLGWNPNAASENITSYRVHMGLTPGLYDWHRDTTEVTYTIDGLTFGTTYYFAVTALNAAGESGYSSELSHTPMPAPTAPGTGLRGQYYNDNSNGAYPLSSPFAGSPVLTRTDATVDFDWDNASPASQVVRSNNFSVKWTGQVRAPVSGSYTFTVTGDDGVRLFLNGELVIDEWRDQYPTSYSHTTTLTAGTLYDIELHYYEHGGDASCRLRWSYPGQSTETIPASQLSPATGP